MAWWDRSGDLKKRFGGRRRVTVLAPYIRAKKGLYREPLARARKRGFSRARIDGEMVDLAPGLALDRYKEHDVDLVVGKTESIDPVVAGSGPGNRLP
mgnify:CR=1 FL=1